MLGKHIAKARDGKNVGEIEKDRSSTEEWGGVVYIGRERGIYGYILLLKARINTSTRENGA